MVSQLFEFDVPETSDPHDRIDIKCALEALAMSAFFLAGDDEMGLRGMVEVVMESTIAEYDPEKVYRESLEELNEIVDGYNYFVNENGAPRPKLKLAVDEEKTGALRGSCEYQVYKIVECG